jgi:hypothetical protein
VQIEVEKEVICEHDGRDDCVFYGAAEREFHHGVRVWHIRYKDSGCVEQVHATPNTARTVIFRRHDFDAAADFACNTRLGARLCNLSFMDALRSEGVEERRFPDIGHPDDEDAVSDEFPALLRVCLEDVEELRYALFAGIHRAVVVFAVSDEHDLCPRVHSSNASTVVPSSYNLLIAAVSYPAAKIALGVHKYPLLSLERCLEQWIARCERNAIVAAFDDKVDGRQERFHLCQARFVVAEKVRARERRKRWEYMARDKGHLSITLDVVVGNMAEAWSR